MIVTINVAVLLAIIVVVRLRRRTHARSRVDEKMTVVLCVTLGVLIAPTAFGKSIRECPRPRLRLADRGLPSAVSATNQASQGATSPMRRSLSEVGRVRGLAGVRYYVGGPAEPAQDVLPTPSGR